MADAGGGAQVGSERRLTVGSGGDEVESPTRTEDIFGETSDTKSLRLVDVRTVGDSLAFLTYRPVRDA
ncbi:hypothetical protein ACIBHX_30270 [Nonomuraea sp. NPDC050536]|uniref:hypothetical protein n=1 Tax=Nonomuraea sp. NPDC050536 TaxID=3364366 RepID=UPI0037C85D95